MTPPRANSTRRDWSVGTFKRWRSTLTGDTASPGNPLAEQVRGARITDRDTGLTYEATIGRGQGQVWLDSLTIIAKPGQRIDQALIRSVPVQRIAEQVALHLAEEDAAGVPAFATRAHRGKHDRPTAEEVAHLVAQGESRQTIATRYGVSASAADKWIAQARRAGLIPPATTGRKPNRSNHAQDQ